MSVMGKELEYLAKRDKSYGVSYGNDMKHLHRGMMSGLQFPPRPYTPYKPLQFVQIETADKSPLRKKQKAHASALDADSKADASGAVMAGAPSGRWSEATFAVQTPPAYRDQLWQTTEPNTASTSEAFDTKMKEVQSRADAEWSAAQALAEGDIQVNHQLRRLSLQSEGSQGPLADEDALPTPEGAACGNDPTMHELQKKLKGIPANSKMEEQDECRQASKFRLHAWGAIQLASNPAPTPLTLLHGTSGLGEAAADVVDQAESPAKSVRPGATLGQSLRAKAKADCPTRRGCQPREKGWEDVCVIEVNRGDDTSIPYAVGDDVYICGPKFDIEKKPFSANFAQPACLVCCMEATTEEDAANLVECSRCTYPGEYLCPACTAGTRSIGADLFAHVKPGCKHTARECFLSGSGHLFMGQILRLLKSKHKTDTYKMCVRRYEAPRDPALALCDRDKYKPSEVLQLKGQPEWFLCATLYFKTFVHREGDTPASQDCAEVADVDNDDHFYCKLGYSSVNKCAVSLTHNMSSDVALHLGEDDVTNADDESDDPDYDSGCNHSCASASADNTDSGSGSDEGGSPSDVDSGHDHIPDPNSSCGTHHGHHHGHGAHTASGNGHATNHSSDHDSDSGSEWGMYGEHEDPDLDTWFGKARSERLCGLSNTAPQAEYALGSDFTSASVPLEACQGRDEKGRFQQTPAAELPVSFGKSQESPMQKADCQVQVQQDHQRVLDPALEVFMAALILKRKQGADPYARALAALHPNREWADAEFRHAEAKQLMEWIIKNPDKQARYLHLSGCSGSGKTLVINTVLRYLQPAGDRQGWKFVTVDAYQAQTVQLFCRNVYEAVTGDRQNRQCTGALDEMLSGKTDAPKKVVLVVDRIDVLGKHADGRKVLVKLGTWKRNGRVLIIGVSCVQTNAPEELDSSSETNFEELKQIIRARLGDNNIFEPMALSIAVHEVKNAASSDVRELLVVCSKAVNYAKSKSCQALADLEPGTSSVLDSTGTVTVEHVRGMLHDERMTASVKRMRGLPPIQMRLLQLVAHQDDKGRRKAWTVKYLCDAVRTSEQWRKVQPDRIHGLVIRLIRCGIFEAANKSPGSFMEVVMRASAQAVEQALMLAKQDKKDPLF
ncbi:MAG: origin recognition complex 1 [Trebouxia sp. A1-2]|nr:MAG: origin recognition complex 1 [Trebouxia sp. A1-2]